MLLLERLEVVNKDRNSHIFDYFLAPLLNEWGWPYLVYKA
jgi:hypothetical protein